jgi:hypothetical protein
MTKTEFFFFFSHILIGASLILAFEVIKKSGEYPTLSPELARYCQKMPNFHPDCTKTHQSPVNP